MCDNIMAAVVPLQNPDLFSSTRYPALTKGCRDVFGVWMCLRRRRRRHTKSYICPGLHG